MNNNNILQPLVIDNLDLLPIGYKKAVKTLIYKINKTPSYVKKLQMLQAFSEKFTVLPKIWKYWYKLVRNTTSSLTLHCGIIYERALKEFPEFEKNEWPFFDDSQKFRRTQHSTIEELKKQLKIYVILPHSQLQEAFDLYAEKDDESEDISKEYKSACKIYEEMKECDIKDGKKYTEILKKTEINEFVIKNIECQLAKNPWSRNLWIAYIQYLENEKKDYKSFLPVLRRYCRLFVKDAKMKEKYQRKIKELSHCMDGISEFWIDSFKFELQFTSGNSVMTLLEKALKTEMNDKMKFFNAALELAEKFQQSNMTHIIQKRKKLYLKDHPEIVDYNFNMVINNLKFDRNTKIQNFPFPKPIAQYLYDNLDHQHLQKLYQTCKWFYYKYRLNLVHRFEYSFQASTGLYGQYVFLPSVKYTKNSVAVVNSTAISENKLKDLWITYSLNLHGLGNVFITQIIKKVTVKYLTLYTMNITEKEFEFLTESKTIEKLYYNHCSIRRTDGTEYMLEDILIKLPKLRQIDIFCDVTAETGERLQEMKFLNKLQRVNLVYHGPLNAEHFCNFLLKNLSANASLNVYGLGGNHGVGVKEYIEQALTQWKPKNEKPKFSWKFYLL